ncbi:hypothetical protein SAMN04487880_2619 [Marinobacter sp. es.042]|nr:hypothetical protein SAMN04487880_2619 [Marinobacter sp. es.042]
MKLLNRLKALETFAIRIMREVTAYFENSRILHFTSMVQAGSKRS